MVSYVRNGPVDNVPWDVAQLAPESLEKITFTDITDKTAIAATFPTHNRTVR
jgi:hypothetical protein